MAVLDSIYNTIAGNIESLITGKYAAIVGLVEGPLQAGLAINLIVCGYAIMRGIANEPWGAYLTTWFKAYLVILAATTSFGPWAATEAQRLPDQLVSALGGSSIAGQFDQFIQTTSKAAEAVSAQAEDWTINLGPGISFTIPDPIAAILYYVVLFFAYVVAAIALVFALFVKFGLAVSIAVGPIFVGLLMFNSTSGFFSSWLGAILNYAIQSAALALVFQFVVGTVFSFIGIVQADGAGAAAVYGALLLQLVIIFVGGFLIVQTSAIASSLAGGGGGASGSALVNAIIPSPRSSGRAVLGAARSVRRATGRRLQGSNAGGPGPTQTTERSSTGITSLRGASSTGPR